MAEEEKQQKCCGGREKTKKCGCGEVAMERNNRNVVVSKPF